jgi:hypothetical protein
MAGPVGTTKVSSTGTKRPIRLGNPRVAADANRTG